MSKQSDAKVAQGYEAKPAARTCGNCAHFASDKVERVGYMGGIFIDEKNIRCGLGGFAVKKMAVCNLFVAAKVAA